MGKRLTTTEFIERSTLVHNGKYDYSKVKYVNSQTKVTIICPIHGEFEQAAINHVTYKNGCLQCKGSKISNTKTKPIEYYIEKFKKVHGDRYDYSLAENNESKKIDIICSKHGIFNQYIQHHIKGTGCPICGFNVSKLEMELQEFIKSLGYEIITNKKNIIKPYELDIFIPALNVAVEFNGDYWHYNKRNPNCKPKGYHAMKSNLCREKGIGLFHVREELWVKNKDQIKKSLTKYFEIQSE